MVTKHLIPDAISNTYEVHEWRNAAGVLKEGHPEEWENVMAALEAFHFKKSEVLVGGGGKSLIAARLDNKLTELGWKERKFATSIHVDEQKWDSPTHKVDCFKGEVGLEIEWNNKDPFFDRDLNNFRLLFDLRVLDVGIIVTRSSKLQELFKELGKKAGAKYGASTTHIDKLLPRLEGGGGGGCPILAFGITRDKYVEDNAPIVQEAPEADDDGDDDGE